MRAVVFEKITKESGIADFVKELSEAARAVTKPRIKFEYCDFQFSCYGEHYDQLAPRQQFVKATFWYRTERKRYLRSNLTMENLARSQYSLRK